MRKNEVHFVARDILSAFLITVAIGWIDLWIRTQSGLEWLVTSAVVSMLLLGLNIAFLWFAFSAVRRICWVSRGTIYTKTVLELSWVVGGGNALLLCLAVALNFFHVLNWKSHDVGWTHYFSLPYDRRPGFLLAYLLLMAVVSCVIGPVLEEFLHVGVIVGRMRDRKINWPVIHLVNAVFFIMLHQVFAAEWIGWTKVIQYACGRIFFDYLFRKTDNIIVPITGHILNNCRALVIDLLPLV